MRYLFHRCLGSPEELRNPPRIKIEESFILLLSVIHGSRDHLMWWDIY